MDLFDVTRRVLQTPEIESVRPAGEFHVTNSCGAQIQEPWGKRIIGACHRAEWYRFKEYPKDNLPTIQALRKMYWGHAIEAAEVDLYKAAGVWIASHVKLWMPEYALVGEVDCFVRDPDSWTGQNLIAKGTACSVIGVELKSTWGYGSKGAIEAPAGTKTAPKPEHVVQAAIYHWFFRKFANYWAIPYMARDSGNARAHKLITLEDGRISVNGEIQDFTIPHIFNRLGELYGKLRVDAPPDRDFQAVWDKEMLKSMADAGRLSKTDTDTVRKGNKLIKGDWNCSSCGWAHTCWNGVAMPYDLTIEDLIKGD